MLHMPTQSRSPEVAGFTMVELLLVMLIITLLAGVGVTAFNSIGQARGVAEGANQVASAIELARSEAVSRQTYVWLALQTQTNFGSSDLRVGLVYSLDGTANTNSTNFASIGKPRLIQRVTLASTASPFNAGANFTNTSTTENLSTNSGNVAFTIGTAPFSSARSVTFTPMGEATTIPTVTNGFAPRIAIGLRQIRGTTPASNNDIAVVIDGSVGVATTYQKTP